MTWIWNGLRLPYLGRFWRCRRERRVPMLDPPRPQCSLAPRPGVRQLIARAESRRAAGPLAPWLVAALDQVLIWIERPKQRAQFANIEPHMLHDLGLSRADLDSEGRKHLWQC